MFRTFLSFRILRPLYIFLRPSELTRSDLHNIFSDSHCNWAAFSPTASPRLSLGISVLHTVPSLSCSWPLHVFLKLIPPRWFLDYTVRLPVWVTFLYEYSFNALWNEHWFFKNFIINPVLWFLSWGQELSYKNRGNWHRGKPWWRKDKQGSYRELNWPLTAWYRAISWPDSDRLLVEGGDLLEDKHSHRRPQTGVVRKPYRREQL